MTNIEFTEEKKDSRQDPLTVSSSGIIGFLINKRIVANKTQANLSLLLVAIVLAALSVFVYKATTTERVPTPGEKEQANAVMEESLQRINAQP
jgi:phosphotransferase system  glucose/maltose/N-acetylglucosamine-specific IIC component